MNKTEANLKKAKFVEKHHRSLFGWIKSWFKKKPKDADNAYIDARDTNDRVEKAEIDHNVVRNLAEHNQNVINNSDFNDPEYKDKAYKMIKENISVIKKNAAELNNELEQQNNEFEQLGRRNKKFKL